MGKQTKRGGEVKLTPWDPKEERPWLVREADRLGPEGRPRSGPVGVAVRELARVTIRARGAVLAKRDALRAAENLDPHELFAKLIEHYCNRLGPERQADVLRAARRRRREHYPETP